MRRLFISAGFPKTATLQNHLSATHPQINYLGKPFSEDLAKVERLNHAHVASGRKGPAKRLNQVLATTVSVRPQQRTAIEEI